MTGTTNAPALILKNLKAFTNALNYLEVEMLAEFSDAATAEVQSFANKHGWFGTLNFDDPLECWLAPRQWDVTPKNVRKPHVLASFNVESIEPNDSHYYLWMSQFCGVTDGEAGLSLGINDRYIDTDKWNQLVASLPSEDSKTLAELGFEHRKDDAESNDGYFFLPVVIDPLALADAWDTGDLTPAMAPLSTALSTLPEAAKVFDRLLNACRI